MKKKDSSKQYDEALKRAAALCSKQEQSTHHMMEKLKEWGIGEQNRNKIIHRLLAERFLDDQRYTEYYARDKFRFNRWGKIKIAHMLRTKGIPAEIINAALARLDEEEYFNACRNLILKRNATIKEKDPYKRRARLLRFAAGRGFETELVHRIIDSLTED